jgi:hypothetical protein
MRILLVNVIRPQPVGEVQFGVGALPQEEVGQPLLAAGADQEEALRIFRRRERRFGGLPAAA